MTHPDTHSDNGPVIPELEDAFRTGLARHTEAERGLTARRSIVVALGAACSAGIIAVVLSIALAASPTGGPVNVLARAQAALGTQGQLVHYVVRVKSAREIPTRGADRVIGDTDCTPPPTEVWQTTQPNRWRALVPANSACVAVKADTDPKVDGLELAWDAGTSTTYDRSGTTIDIVTGYPANSSAGVVPIGIRTAGSGDPVAVVQILLAERRLTARGTRRVDGREVRHLIGQRQTTYRDITTRERYAYDVDPDTFEPIRITQTSTSRPTDTSNRCGSYCRGLRVPQTLTLTFESYERRPLNDEAKSLLRIKPPAGTSTRRRTQDELRKQLARRRGAE